MRRGRFELPAPEDPGRRGLYRPSRKVLYGFVAVIAVVGIVRSTAHHGKAGVSLTTSCTTASFAVREHDVPKNGALSLAVTGPAADGYLVYVDAQAVTPAGVVTPYPGVPVSQTPLLVRVSSLPTCIGATTVRLPPAIGKGHHTLVLFQVVGGVTTVQQTIPITTS